MTKRSLFKGSLVLAGIVVVVAGLLAAARWHNAAGPTTPRYNVLLITLDTTRADHLHCYGYKKETSPNLDALAADGVRFDCAFSASAITPVSHASILTGMNPDRHGLRVFYGSAGRYLAPTLPTLATVLKSHGWQTAAFVSAFPASERYGLHHGFDTFSSDVSPEVKSDDPADAVLLDGFWRDQRTALAQRRSDATVDEVLDWLAQKRRPFFVWTHLFDPHDLSLIPPKEIMARFGITEYTRGVERAAYDPEIYFMDMQIGRLLDYLKATGEYEKTVIIAVADHGQGLGDHGWFYHRLLYQEQIRIPLIVRSPDRPRGVVVSAPVRSIDILPTVLDKLRVEPPEGVQGLDLCGLMRGRPEGLRGAYAEALNTLDPQRSLPEHQDDLLFCVIEYPWKLVYHFNSPENTELYNLAADPSEGHNLAVQRREEMTRLLAELEDSGAMSVHLMDPNSPLDDESTRKLKSLGYIGDTK